MCCSVGAQSMERSVLMGSLGRLHLHQGDRWIFLPIQEGREQAFQAEAGAQTSSGTLSGYDTSTGQGLIPRGKGRGILQGEDPCFRKPHLQSAKLWTTCPQALKFKCMWYVTQRPNEFSGGDYYKPTKRLAFTRGVCGGLEGFLSTPPAVGTACGVEVPQRGPW